MIKLYGDPFFTSLVLKGAIATLRSARKHVRTRTVVTKEWNTDCSCGGCIEPWQTAIEDHSREAIAAAVQISQIIHKLYAELKATEKQMSKGA
jgi:hypothetical protein